MIVSFSKYQAAGNDFIVIDDRNACFPVTDSLLIQKLCSRHFGVGADGLILLQSSSSANFRMRIFNSDGLEAAMCGNGIRCLILYLKKIDCKGDIFLIETQRLVLSCSYNKGKVSVDLPCSSVLHWGVKLIDDVNQHELFVVDTGVPHAVIFIQRLEDCPVERLGRWIRFHSLFAPEGVNVNFIEVVPDGAIHIRTYERGIEGETLSCGTGAAASALVVLQKNGLEGPVRVVSKSGESLEFLIKETLQGKKIEMRGFVTFVFEGRIEL